MDVTYFLKQFSLFSVLPVEVIREYFETAKRVTFLKDEPIIDYNSNIENLYIILSGSVKVYLKDADQSEYLVDKLKPGDCLGVISILAQEKQPLKVKARKAVEAVILPKEALFEMLELHPKINRELFRIITRRLHYIYYRKEKRVEEITTQDAKIHEDILHRKEKELLFLDTVHNIIASEKSFKAKLAKITKGIVSFYGIDMCLLYLYERDNRHIKLYAANDSQNVYAASCQMSQNDDIVRWIKDNKAILSLNDEEEFKLFSNSMFLSGSNFKHLMFVPLIEDKEVVGILVLLGMDPSEYSDEDRRFLEIVTANFIGIIRKEQFDYEAHLRSVELDTLKAIGEAANRISSLSELVEFIVKSATKAMNAKMCTLRLHDPLSDAIRIKDSHGFTEDTYKVVSKGMEKHLKETVIGIGEYVIINNTERISRFSEPAKKLVRSLISVPFQLHDKVIGMITVYEKVDDAMNDTFDQNDLRLLTAIATHTSIMVENTRLYDELAYSQSGAKVQMKFNTEILGESYKAKKVNESIKKFAVNADSVLIYGEMGIGKTFVARCIHFSSTRLANHFIVEDCRNFDDKQHGADLFGRKSSTKNDGEGIRGLLEQSHDGTLTLRHLEVLSKEVQEKLYDYLITKKYKQVGDTKDIPSDVKLIFQSNLDLAKLVENDQFDARLYELVAAQTINLPALRNRKKDLPIIIEYFLGVINKKLQKNVTNISENGLGMLMSYDWPGNIMELHNVLERGVLVASQDTILSEQIFLGIPRAEGENRYNLLRFKWVSDIMKSRYYPGVFQLLSVIYFFVIIFFAFLSPIKGDKNIAVIVSWMIGWPLLFISFVFLGRIFCTICPFSSIAKFIQKFANFGLKMPSWLKRRSNVIAVTFCFAIIWFEEVTNIFSSPQTTGILVLFIFTLTVITSVIYQRMVWCRYLCPWGILNGLFAMASVIELRSNRHICLTQCKTNVCYEGSETVPGCPMFEHPYGMESNKNCTLCGNCIKNCPNNSIQLNTRLVAKELWVKVHPHISDSLLGISLVFLLLLKKLLEIDSISGAAFFGYERFSLTGGAIYTGIYLLTILFSYGMLRLVNYTPIKIEDKKHKVRENIGYAFIPLALFGFLSYYIEPLLMQSPSLIYAWKNLLFNTPFPAEIVPLVKHTTIKNLQVVLILFGGGASGYSSYKIISHKLKVLNRDIAAYKLRPIWLIAFLTIAYLVLI